MNTRMTGVDGCALAELGSRIAADVPSRVASMREFGTWITGGTM